jgi:transposase InsO family protein
VSRIAAALGVSRPHLASSSKAAPLQRAAYLKAEDAELVRRIRAVVDGRPTYGYRRVTAMLNREKPPRVNHKRVYRLMRREQLLLARHSSKPQRPHDVKVITLASNMRWCSDGFEIRCWNGEKVHVAFALDCCDREVISWVASSEHLVGESIRDLMSTAIEARFGGTKTPSPVEWLSDNGPPYTANETRAFGTACGLLVCNTPAYSPESNGMAEAFVKTFKRDYVYVGRVDSAAAVLDALPNWFRDYNENHPHQGLNMLSPRQFRRAQTNP